MSLLDVTIVNVGIPSLRAGLDASLGTVQWVVSGYALTFGLVLVTGGRLGDAYGRRALMATGLAGFVASSAAVGFAPTAEVAVLARLVQGASAGLLAPQNAGLIQQLFAGAERGRAFGLFGFTVGVASATGPLLGGLIIGIAGEDDGWRWLFLINLPIGLLALWGVWRLVPGPEMAEAGAVRADGSRSRPQLDVPGSLLLGAAVLAVLYPVVAAEGGARLPLLLLPAAPVLLAAFVWWERRVRARGRSPLLDIGLLRRTPGYADALAVGLLYFTGFTGMLLVLSVFAQEQLGYSALSTGLLLTPFAGGTALGAPLAGRVVHRRGRMVTVTALTVMLTGVAVTAVTFALHPEGILWGVVVPALFVAGLGGGGVVSPNLTLGLEAVPPRMGGVAGAALQTGQRLGSATGAALLMTAYQLARELVPDAGQAFSLSLVVTVLMIGTALAVAVRSLRRPGGRRPVERL